MADATPSTHRQVAWVIDLNRCIGCQTCSVACKVLWTQGEGEDPMWWCTVNTKPGRGTPRDWEQMGGGYRNGELALGRLPTAEEFGEAWEFNHAEVYESGKGQDAFLKPIGAPPTWGMNWDEDIGAGTFPNAHFFYLPRLCNHCSRPACLEACPNDAIYKREEDGLVLRDEDRCKGAQTCARACPYKKIYFNPARKVSQHCIGCFPRLEKGVAPACVRQCPGRAVFFGFLDDAKATVHRLVREWEVALPLHAEWNTEPNVFYIPPLSTPWIREDGSVDESRRRLPTGYLESLFGPRVRAAVGTLESEMSKRRQGRPSELMKTLIAYDWKEMLGPFTRDPAELTWS
ncbi:MAG: respiratory nitrate reductase subunit beta [Myxococcales bacterium]|nr:respiratory nitrate reductase subunit beta [Myxococcales bacterium]